MADEILTRPGRLVGGTVYALEETDSTNRVCLDLAAQGAPEGTAVLARRQTAGRGRQGRSFLSAADSGLYLSVLLRPKCPAERLGELTAWTGAAVCEALEALCGLSCGVKWVNDIILEGKKLGGILSELVLTDEGKVDHVVLGVGLNITTTAGQFGPDLARTAISLAQVMGDKAPGLEVVTEAVLDRLDEMYDRFPADHAHYLARYRALCVTTGREVTVHGGGGEPWPGFALEVDDHFSLVVRREDGSHTTVRAGQVSVRGADGYL